MNINEKLSRHEKHCQNAKTEYLKLQEYLGGFNLDSSSPIQFHCQAMALSVWETMYCMLHLRKLESDNQMFPMLRQIMELSCYLAFIAIDPQNNYEKIVQKDFDARLKYLGRNHGKDDDEGMINDRNELLENDAHLREKHGIPPSFYQIVEAVAPIEFYETYRFLSPFTHSNLVSLERRFQKNTDGGLVILKPMPEEDMVELWTLSVQFLQSVQISIEILKEKLRPSDIEDDK